MNLGVAIRTQRTAKGWTLEKLSEASGVDVGTISALEIRESTRSKYTDAIARGLGMSIEELLSGEVSNPAKNEKNALNVEPVQAPGALPLISWVQAGIWSDVADPYAVGDAEDWLPCPSKHGPRAYCLRVRGDSMHNPTGGPSYAHGDIIFVDPDREAKAGDRVIVRLDDQQEATFKQLLVEDGRTLLKALNPDWKPRYIEINGNATITGVVIGKWTPE